MSLSLSCVFSCNALNSYVIRRRGACLKEKRYLKMCHTHGQSNTSGTIDNSGSFITSSDTIYTALIYSTPPEKLALV